MNLFNKFELKHETPVTNLSKRFSLTNFCDKKSVPDPIFIDESANQEPPSSENYTNVYPSFGEDPNSCSSGYFSNCSVSAPSTCNLNLTSNKKHELWKLDNFNVKTIADPYQRKLEKQDSRYRNFKLRRCHSTSWLSKRRGKRDSVPVISRIIRRTSLNQPKCRDLFRDHDDEAMDCDKTQIILNLPSLDESESATTKNSTKTATPHIDSSTLQTPGKAKRARLISISNDMETTQLLPSQVLQSIGTFTNEWSRHHSTPTSRFKKTIPTDDVMSPLGYNSNFSKPLLSRFHSVPVPNVGSDAMIGDMLPASLPVSDKTSSGLNCISANTMNDILNGKFENKNINYTIIDCRYPYEFVGGHIKGAQNLYTQDKVLYNVFNQIPAKNPNLNGFINLGPELNRKLSEDQTNDYFNDVSVDLDDSLSVSFTSDEIEKMNSVTREDLSSQDSLGDETSYLEMTAADELHNDILQASMDHSRTRHSSVTDINNALFSTINPLSMSACSDVSDKSHLSDLAKNPNKEAVQVIIFHCEFSSQRAPSLATFLRSIDRTSNFHRYPFLYFPEIYILKGGYSEFYKSFPDQCTPHSYRTMFDRNFRNDLIFEKRMTKGITEACLSLLRNHKGLKANVPQALLPKETCAASNMPFSLSRHKTVSVASRPFLDILEESRHDSSTTSTQEQLETKRQLFGSSCDLTQICCDEEASDEAENLSLVGQIIKLSKRLSRFHHCKFGNSQNNNNIRNQSNSPLSALPTILTKQTQQTLDAASAQNNHVDDKPQIAQTIRDTSLSQIYGNKSNDFTCNNKENLPNFLSPKRPFLPSDMFKSFEMSATPNAPKATSQSKSNNFR